MLYPYTVWNKKGFGIHEKALLTTSGDYVGINSGNLYSKDEYYHSPQFQAKIIACDKENLTGMYHLCDDTRRARKAYYIGCLVTVEAAHHANALAVYRVCELQEYFTENELEILVNE